MNTVRNSVILNVVGLVFAVSGSIIFIVAFPGHLLPTVMTAGGLLLISGSSLLLIVTMARNRIKGGVPESVAKIPPTNQEQLATALQNLQDRAIDLIERRRWIHYLNTRQSNYVHSRETNEEVEAIKMYREAKDELDYRRLESPTLSWRSIDSFKEAVEKSILQEVYSPPSDQQVHNSINQQRLRTLEEIDSIAADFIICSGKSVAANPDVKQRARIGGGCENSGEGYRIGCLTEASANQGLTILLFGLL